MIYLIGSLIESLSAMELFAIALAYFIAICVAITFHECAHAFTAYKCGDDTAKRSGRLTLNPFAHMSGFGLICFVLIGFGWAKPVPINPAKFRSYRKNTIWVILSGVLANFILAFVFAGILVFTFVPLLSGIDNLLCFFLFYFINFSLQINIILMLFNLLPIPPLDGFNLISMLTKYGNKFVDFMIKYGFIILIALILPIFGGHSALGLFYDFALPLFESYFMFFWGLFL